MEVAESEPVLQPIGSALGGFSGTDKGLGAATPEKPSKVDSLRVGLEKWSAACPLVGIRFTVEAADRRQHAPSVLGEPGPEARDEQGGSEHPVARFVGLVSFRPEREQDELHEGVLVRAKRSEAGAKPKEGDVSYTLWSHGQPRNLPFDEVEDFLRERRKGRGGLGRAQGRRAKDGACYTQATTMMLTPDEVVALLDLGGEDVSLGLRTLARKAAARLQEDAGWLGTLEAPRTDRPAIGEGQTRQRVKLYMDSACKETLAAVGGGTATTGVRRLLGALPF